MKKILQLLVLLLIFQSCKKNNYVSSIDPINWDKRVVNNLPKDSLIKGATYLSVYSQIYSQTEHIKHDLTVTVSMRNTNDLDTIYIQKAAYFDTKGKLIRTYFDQTIFIAPMETVEIIIDETDQEGGTGANFLFHWMTKPRVNEPFFESVMITTSGQQGISFTTRGKRVK